MVYAVDITPDNFAPAKIGSISTVLNLIIPLILITASLLFVSGMVMGGLKWITAGGDQKKMEEAQKQFTWPMIGFVFVMISFLLTKLICFVTNVPCAL